MKKRFTVTLDANLVSNAQEHLKENGAKLSPIMNNLLERWVNNMVKIKKDSIKRKKRRFKNRSKKNG